MNVYLAGMLLSILAYICVGLYVGRRIKTVEDYYVSGRNCPTILITGTLFASMLSTTGFMGDTAYCYNGNVTTIILLNSLCASGYVFGALFFGRYIRRAKINTMPMYFGLRFNSTRIRRFAGLTTIVSITAYLLAVMQGTGMLMETATGLDRVSCLFIAWVCFVSFTFYSGSKGVIITDTMQFLLFLFATIIGGPAIFKAAGGLQNLVVNLAHSPNTPADLLSFHGNVGKGTAFDIVMYAITMGAIWLLTVGVSPWQAGRNLMAKNEHVIFRSGAMAAILTVVFLTYLYLMAISVILIYPHMAEPEKVIIWTAFNVMPTVIGVAVLAGILAAGLAHGSTFLSVIGFSITDVILGVEAKGDAAHLRFTRIVVLLVGLVALFLAYLRLSNIRIISWFASTIIASSWGFVAFASVWSKRLTERGAFYSMVGGFVGYLGSKCLQEFAGWPLKNFFDPFFIGLAVSVVLGILGSLGQEPTSEEVAYQQKLHVIPESDAVPAEYKRDRLYGWIMVGSGLAISVLFIWFWALPYNAAIGKEISLFGSLLH
jgi:sodium/pantothenate symporter